MAGVIESTQVPMLFDRVKKQEVSGDFTGNFSSATGTPYMMTLAGSGSVTVKPEDGDSAIRLWGGAQLNIIGDNTVQQTIDGGGRVDYVLGRFSTRRADMYVAAAAIVTGYNNKQQKIYERIDSGGGARLDARVKFKQGYMRLDTSVFALGEQRAYYDSPQERAFILSARELFEARVKQFKFTVDGFAYINTAKAGASRFSASGSIGYAASERIEVGGSVRADINLDPLPNVDKVYQARTVYAKVAF